MFCYSGVLGSGVCVFSKHPIVDTHFHKWMVNGYVHKLHHGDWFGGKGIGLCQIKWKGMLLNIYSAHVCLIIKFLSKKYIKICNFSCTLNTIENVMNIMPAALFKPLILLNLLTLLPHLLM